jgi:hypothetical protein
MKYDSVYNCKKCKEWYDGTKEIVVAVRCIFCDCIVLGHGGKKLCSDCQLRWGRKIPQKIIEDLSVHPSFEHYPLELLSWKRILFLREQGITSLRYNLKECD